MRYPPAQWQASPHFNQRPPGCDVSLLVIHNISLPPNDFSQDWVTPFFQGQLPKDAHPYFAEIADLKVSAHVFIRRDGHIMQYVSFTDRAWHAGRSVYQGRDECNDYSIGIELEGTDTHPYTDEQYTSLLDLSIYLMRQFPQIRLGSIVGHNDIAPGRKTDPGVAFDWPRYRQALVTQLAKR